MGFDNNLRNEMLVILNSEKVCGDCQIKIMSQLTKFVDNLDYMVKIKEMLDLFFAGKTEINFWVELPKIISVIIDFNKKIWNKDDEICVDNMKFILYGVIYNYLDMYQPQMLNLQDQGDLRICFLNILGVLLTKPKKIKVLKESLWHILTNCVCGDDGSISI